MEALFLLALLCRASPAGEVGERDDRDLHLRERAHPQGRGDAAVRRAGQRADGDERQPGGDGQPDALGLRADGGKQREQHECLPVWGHIRLPDGRGRGADAGGVSVLRRASRKVHHQGHLPGPSPLRLL